MDIFKRRCSVFLPYEERILSAIGTNLNIEAQEKYRKQLSIINLVQRLNQNREVNMYYKENGKLKFDDKLSFPLTLEEVCLAKVKIEIDKMKRTLIASVWMVKGRIFSINFNLSPKILNKELYKITGVQILEDPMQKFDLIPIEVEDSFIQMLTKQGLDVEVKKYLLHNHQK